MTGRDLILYILKNNLEDEQVFDRNGKFIGFMTMYEAAVKFEVGIATVRAWADMHWIDSVKVGDEIYIPVDAENPINKPQLVMNGVKFYVK